MKLTRIALVSLIMLMAWRPAAMDPERWQRLCASHEAELWLIKAQIERDYQGGAPVSP